MAVAEAQQIGDAHLFKQDYLAIDRFTGGGIKSRKFDAVACWQPSYQLCISLEAAQDWEIGLLLLALRDLQSGMFAFGTGAAKGMGIAKLCDAKLLLIGQDAQLVQGNAVWSGALPGQEIDMDNFRQTDII